MPPNVCPNQHILQGGWETALTLKLLDLALFAINDNAAPKGGVWWFYDVGCGSRI
jgi:hypothetical protein